MSGVRVNIRLCLKNGLCVENSTSAVRTCTHSTHRSYKRSYIQISMNQSVPYKSLALFSSEILLNDSLLNSNVCVHFQYSRPFERSNN